MRSVDCAGSHGIGHTHYCFLASSQNDENLLFELLPADFTDLHEIWHTASVDPSDKKLSKDL